jgi:hypothetical protein
MSPANWQFFLTAANHYSGRPINRLADRVRLYFDRHPEVSREEFLLDAIRKEIHVREHREREIDTRGWGQGFGRLQPLTDEDFRIHAWLTQRVLSVDHGRRGLWQKLRDFLFG